MKIKLYKFNIYLFDNRFDDAKFTNYNDMITVKCALNTEMDLNEALHTIYSYARKQEKNKRLPVPGDVIEFIPNKMYYEIRYNDFYLLKSSDVIFKNLPF